MSRLTRNTGLPNPSRETQVLRRERGQGNINFPCPADHEQDWQPCMVTHIDKSMDQPGKVANRARGQLNRENHIPG